MNFFERNETHTFDKKTHPNKLHQSQKLRLLQRKRHMSMNH